MTEPKTCPDCGGSLPPDALDGACPRCLLAAGLDDPGDGGGARAARRTPPSVEEMAAHFPSLVVEALIGAGGMGIVYRARQTALDRLVALKVLWPELAEDRAFAGRFTREARAMARLDHPNIVRVFEFGERDGLFYLVMEHVDGKSLRELMDEGGIRPEEALAIVPQICAALQYAHDQGVVHRDIKPANVLVDRTGRVRIADFGLAKLVEGGDDVALTRAGQVMGTLQYMAPEQYRTPDHVDHRADIYSLGVVFYEMLTGDVPVGRFEAPSERVRIDVRLDQVVLRSLERQPERRYQKASDVGTAVTSISSGAAPPAAAAPPVAAAAAASAAAPAAAAASAAVKPPPRLSRLAVASLALVGLQAVLALLALAAPPLVVLSLFAAALALGIGFFAWVRVLGSGGRLRGAGYAFTALIAPWFVGCGGFLLLGTVAARHGIHSVGTVHIDEDGMSVGDIRIEKDGVRIGDWIQIDDNGVRVNQPIEIDDRGVRRVAPVEVPVPPDGPMPPDPPRAPGDVESADAQPFVLTSPGGIEKADGLPFVLTSPPFGADPDAVTRAVADIEDCWALLRETVRSGVAGDRPPELLVLYVPGDAAYLGVVDAAELRKRRESDTAGLPLIREPFRGALPEYEPCIVQLAGDGLSATLTLSRGGPRGERLRCVLRRDDLGWMYTLSQVDVIPAEPETR